MAINFLWTLQIQQKQLKQTDKQNKKRTNQSLMKMHLGVLSLAAASYSTQNLDI